MKPNIIVFMTDHQRGDTILNSSKVKTPNIDRFRSKSITFSNAYCPSPHCCPSRASFFTGLYPSEHGVWNNVGVSNTLSHGLFSDTKLFTDDLRENGYDLYISGKWHISSEQGPEDFGFENLFTSERYSKSKKVPDIREWHWYTEGKHYIDKVNEERTEGRIVRPGYDKYIQYGIDESPFKDAEVVNCVVEKLNTIDQNKPFFMFVGTLGPHDPYFVPQRFLDMYNIDNLELPKNFYDNMDDKPALYRRTKSIYSQLTPNEHKECIRRFYAFCSYEDYLFGKIFDAVESRGIFENTIILYVSDHGDYMGSHGLWAKGLPCFREAYHVCSMLGGGLVKNPGRVEDDLVSLTDWAPTFLQLAEVYSDRRFAGKSLVPFINNIKPDNWRTDCYTQTNGNEVYGIQRSVWNKKWKYVFNTFDFDELYDLENDPYELKNLLHGIENVYTSQYNDVLKEMCNKMWSFSYENKDNCVNPYIGTAFAPYGPGIIFNKNQNNL